ncbi:MAG TPA: hypothetical protein VMX55_12095 [candidate division Zixibacteria bacterium]|nr:hypothetical protein [candidate division Zixibacteria bacterium]
MVDEIAARQITELERMPFKSFAISFNDWHSKKNWKDITEKASTILFLIAFAMLVRLLFAYYFRVNFPIGEVEIIWNRNVLFNPNGKSFAGYTDFDHYYYNWVNFWYKDDWYPFTNWQDTVSGDPWYYYSYPPIFLYFLVSIWRPGMTDIWIAMPMILADAACAGMIYLILNEIFKERKAIAFLGGVLMVLAPVNVIYDGVYWLNPGPVTLLTLISFFFVVKRKWWQAFFWLALATMTKQNALFLTYPIFMIMLGEKVHKKGVKKGSFESILNVGLFISTCLLISIPWIFITPLQYGVHLLFPGKFLQLNSSVESPPPGQPNTFSWALYVYNIRGVVLDIVAFGINSMILMIAAASIITIYLLWRAFRGKMDNIEFFEMIAIYMILTHIFMPRGVFKFYSAYYIPVILLAIVCSLMYYKEKFIIPISIILIVSLFFGFNIWHQTSHPYFLPLLLFLMSILLLGLNIIRNIYKKKIVKKDKMNKNFSFN